MEFLKNHYEKVILSVVLLGLAVAVAILPSKMPAPAETGGGGSGAKLAPLDLKTNEAPLQRLEQYQPLVLNGEHNLFNPVQWRRRPDGSLWKIVRENEVGPGALQVLKISPLHFVLSYDGFLPPKFQIGTMQETNKNPNLRAKIPVLAGVGDKTDLFKITGFNGPADAPVEVTVELNDGKTVSLSKDKPYKVVVGYTADLRYAPENLPLFREKRVDDKLLFDGDTNNIVDIASNQVVLSASSGKRTKLSYNAAP
jgi:hypothetical protein